VPTPVLVLALQFYNDEAAERVFASVQARMLTPGANISAWEKLLVARHCARMLRDTGPAAPILPAPAAAPIGLTPEEQAELNAIAAQPGTFGGGLSNASPRYQALAMLKELGPHIRPAVPALTALLDDTDSYSVLEATHLLGRASGSRASIAALTRQMASPLYHYRSAAARALGEHGPAAASAIPAIYEAVSRPKDSIGNVGVNALTKIGAASTRTLVGLLSDPRPSLRYSAADAMKKLGPRSATPEVLLALGRTRREDPIATVRLGAVIALGSLAEGDPKTAVPLLAEALGDQYAMVRYSAVKSLHALGPDAAAAADALRTATSSKEEYLSEAAAAALRAVQAAPKP
jgi:HEAT repeat protein